MIKAYLSQTLAIDTLFDKIDDIVAEHKRAVSGANLVEMIENYELLTLGYDDKVLLVAHSQGNLYGNEVFDNLLTDAYQKKFDMVSVGTPANRVLDGVEPYTTLTCDLVINSIPGHLESKMPCFSDGHEDSSGHEFEKSYLTNKGSYDEIVENIKKKLEKTCKDPSLFEILSHENINTENWRVTVKNRETNETQSGVYPFNLNGSLYELDSGSLVIASCGGTDIESVWNGQKENEFYKLNGTNPIEYIKSKEMNKFVGYIGLSAGISTWNVKTYREIYPPRGAFYTKPYAVISHIEKEFYSLYSFSSLSTLVLSYDDSTQGECRARAKSLYEEILNYFDNKIITISGINYKIEYSSGYDGSRSPCVIKRRGQDPSPLYIYAEFRISK